jgi:hypothetical protein
MSKRCAHCGAPILPEVQIQGRVRNRIWDFMSKFRSATPAQLMEYVYEDDPDGGPETDSTLKVNIFHMNKVLKKHGLRIQANPGRGATYRLRLL